MEPILQFDRHSSSEDYDDYIYHFAIDENGLGGYLRVTFVQEPGRPAGAYMEICINNEDGHDLIQQCLKISRKTAEQMIAVQFDGQRV